jgi:hypothetical protein
VLSLLLVRQRVRNRRSIITSEVSTFLVQAGRPHHNLKAATDCIVVQPSRMQFLWPKARGGSLWDQGVQRAQEQHTLRAILCNLVQLTQKANAQFIQLLLIDWRGAFGHQVDGARSFWEGDDIADRVLTRQKHGDAV